MFEPPKRPGPEEPPPKAGFGPDPKRLPEPALLLLVLPKPPKAPPVAVVLLPNPPEDVVAAPNAGLFWPKMEPLLLLLLLLLDPKPPAPVKKKLVQARLIAFLRASRGTDDYVGDSQGAVLT